MLAQGNEDVVQTPAVFWSPDSTRIATYVMDQRNFPRLTMTIDAPRSVPSEVFQLCLSAAGGFRSPDRQARGIRHPKRKQIRVRPGRSTSCTTVGRRVEWAADSSRFTYREIERGYGSAAL